jgi:hypothetical protein
VNDATAKALEIASRVTSPVSVVAIAIVAGIVFMFSRRAAPKLAWIFLIIAVTVVSVAAVVRTMVQPVKYQIRVRIEGPDGQLLKLQSGVDLTGAPHEMSPREGNAEWLFQVFPQDLPPDKHVVISATASDLSANKETALVNYSTSITLRLKRASSAEIAGTVIDRVTGRALSGATIYVVGQSGELKVTDRTGGFRLDAHVPAEQLVLLHTECQGFRPDHDNYAAGRSDLTISLEPLRVKKH